jgi:hypothetical protein
MDFLWHQVSEKEKQEIETQAKSIMDNFAKALEKVPNIKEKLVERAESTRKEKEGKEAHKEFRRIMFENFRNKDISDSDRKSKDFRHAPDTEGDCIKAEKGAWTNV